MSRRLFIILAFTTLGVVLVYSLVNRSSAPPPSPKQSTPRVDRLKYEVPVGSKYQGISDPRWGWWNAMQKQDRSFEWKVPIRFFGRVVDQDNKPVSTAHVRYGWNDVTGSHEQYTRSDAGGRFAIEGLHGKVLSVDVSKAGYYALKTSPHAFEYAAFFEADYHQPDPARPVTFQLIKKLDQEALIKVHISEGSSYDRPSYYDLERGILTEQSPAGAGLRFIFERSESQQGQSFDWKWQVTAVNGAIMESKNEFAQLAPKEGYLQTWQTSQAASSPLFCKTAHVCFYFRSLDNRYAWIAIALGHPNLRKIGPQLTIESSLNSSGSSNLDADPTMN